MARRYRRGYRGYGGQIAAPHANECTRCGQDMTHTADMVRTSGGRWIHRWCASGADDE